MDICIRSYNILSTALSSKERYPVVEEEYLKIEYRWQLLNKQLSSELINKPIFCFQEVSVEWLNKLNSFFQINEYFVTSDLYGSKETDYMGVLIAIPNSKYLIVNTSIFNPNDTIKNQAIVLQLADKNNNNIIFNIATYHMPCSTDNMILENQVSCLINTIDKLAKDNPYIVVGDFNFNPENNAYKIILQTVKSAYLEKLGYEPEYTNLNYQSHNFKKCIDFIFISNDIIVKDVLNLPKLSEKYFPSKNHPSDHLMIGATLNTCLQVNPLGNTCLQVNPLGNIY
jgi:hypothetical protein